MNKILSIIIFFLIGITFLHAQNNIDESKAIIIHDLNKIESLYFKNLTIREKEEAFFLTNEIIEALNTIIALSEINSSGNNYNILSDDGFDLLYRNVENEISEYSKTESIIKFTGNGKILCRHLEKLVSLYSSDLMKENLIKAVSDKILDPVNIGIVLKHINSSIIRNNLTDFFYK